MESRKTKGGKFNFGGSRWYVYLVHIDSLTLLLVHWRQSRGVGRLSFYPKIALQHTPSFCKTFSVLIRRYIRTYRVNGENVVVIAKKTLLFLTPLSLKCWIAQCWKQHFRASRFQNFQAGGGHAPDHHRHHHHHLYLNTVKYISH